MVYLAWVVAALFLVQFYSCNLRANLISPSFEKPIDTMEDILERGTTLYVPSYYRLSRQVVQPPLFIILVLISYLFTCHTIVYIYLLRSLNQSTVPQNRR